MLAGWLLDGLHSYTPEWWTATLKIWTFGKYALTENNWASNDTGMWAKLHFSKKEEIVTCGLRWCSKRCSPTVCAPRTSLRWRTEAAQILDFSPYFIDSIMFTPSLLVFLWKYYNVQLTLCWKYQKIWSGGWGEVTMHLMAWDEPTFRKTSSSPSISLTGSGI